MAACGRRAGGPPGAPAAAAIAACNPFLVWCSQEARSYALLTLLSAASLLAFLHARYQATQPTVVTPAEALGDVFDRPAAVMLDP